MNRERSMMSQVHLTKTTSDVSSIPDYDIFFHTKQELLAEKKKKEKKKRESTNQEGGWEKTYNSDVFSALGGEQSVNDSKKQGSGHIRKMTDYNAASVLSTTDRSNATKRQGLFKSDAANNYYHAMQFAKNQSASEALFVASSPVEIAPTENNTSKKGNYDDPPLAEYPSPKCSPDEETLGYPGVPQEYKRHIMVPDKLKLDMADVDPENCEIKKHNSDVSTAASTNASNAASVASDASASRTHKKTPDEKLDTMQPSPMEEEPMMRLAESGIEHNLESFNYTNDSFFDADVTFDTNEFDTNIFESITKGVSTMMGHTRADGILHARKVTDLLNTDNGPSSSKEVTGSLVRSGNVEAISGNGRKKGIGRFHRSMTPMVLKKKKTVAVEGVENTDKSGDKSISKKGSINGAPSSIGPSLLSKNTKLQSVRFMSPSLFKKENKSVTTAGGKGHTSDVPTTASTSNGYTSVSPAIILSSSTDPRQCIGSTSAMDNYVPSQPITKKRMALPPLIPLRTVVEHQQEQEIPNIDDDGSVECSVMTEVHSLLEAEKEPETHIVSSVASLVVPKKESEKKSRMEIAKAKMAKHQPKKRTEEGKAVKAPGETVAADDATITSSTSSKIRKKDKLRKIMEYRNRASPTPSKKLQQETIDEWSLAKKRSHDAKVALAQKKKPSPISIIEGYEGEEEMILLDTISHRDEEENQSRQSMTRTVPPKTDSILSEAMDSKRTVSSKEGSDSNSQTKKEKLVKDESGEDQDQEDRHVCMHPGVKQINICPNAFETDDADAGGEVSLPPELKHVEVTKIWEEASFTETVNTKACEARSTRMLASNCMTCGAHKIFGDDDAEVIDDITNGTTDDDSDDSLLGDGQAGQGKCDSKASGGSRFVCGVEIIPRELKDDLIDGTKELKHGLRWAIRNLFGACDITRGDGVDILGGKVNATNDQLFGRAPMPPSSNVGSPSSISSQMLNPQAEKMATILHGGDVQRRRSQERGKRELKSGQTEDRKQRRYRKQLKELSLKHF